MSAPATAVGSVADSTTMTFRLPDRYRRLDSVRLVDDVGIIGDDGRFAYRAGQWQLRLPRPAVDRLEYLYEIVDHNRARTTIPDPTNPLRAPGAFGEKSVLEFPGYQPPHWLGLPPAPFVERSVAVVSEALADDDITGELWTIGDLGDDEAAPLLVVHDGPEYAELGSLTRYLAASVRSGSLPALRAALLGPGDRNRWYAADPGYARALCAEVIPALDVATTACVGLGVSLGGLAMLHAHRLFPTVFDALFLQSASFFTPQLDPQERQFGRFDAVTRFVADVEQSVTDPDPIPVTLTCGGLEENLANNRAMAATLDRLGYPVTLHVVRDVHNYVGWRDALDPALTDLITKVAARAS
jgi:enterochelin esterase family protein